MGVVIVFVLMILISFIKQKNKQKKESLKREELLLKARKAEEQRKKDEIEQERLKRLANEAEEAERLKAHRQKLLESYFIEEDEQPYSKDEILALLKEDKLKLTSKLKFGKLTEEYKTLISFEEFNQNFKDFL